MDKTKIAFIIAAIQVRCYKNISELRCKLNPDNKNEKMLLDYLDCLEYSSKACSTR